MPKTASQRTLRKEEQISHIVTLRERTKRKGERGEGFDNSQEDGIPDEEEPRLDDGQAEDDSSERGQTGDDLGVHPL